MTQSALQQQPVLRIFISSTAVDLRDYRDKVRDVVLRLEGLPIAMETFSALSGQPVDECRKMAAEADAVICIVAHRYGYVPPAELGGDGERSITWLEVDAAQHANKPVFVFVVHPQAKWTELKEQDRLTSEPPENADSIVKAVQKLQEFKTYLGREFTSNPFSSEEELATLVAITLAKFSREQHQAPVSSTRVWHPLFCHALQPAQHFRGREAKLRELKDWLETPVTPDRVISVVAAGGTGKTALVHEALAQAKLSTRSGVFVWSFYEDPHVDAFLRAAYLYFTGEKDPPAGGLLERLQMALSGDLPHLLVLDGLERVQSEGDHRRRGELEDLQLKRLLRTFAGSGNTRALVTSRFPLVDLESFSGAGHRAISLDDLEQPVALDVLRAWGVIGDDAALMKLVEPLNIRGFYHALSVAVLGSYIGNFAAGDPGKAPEFSLKDAEESDPKARRLNRILEQYAQALTAVERDLLARLSLFPRGVKVEILGWIVQAGGETAGALIGLTDYQLLQYLERLKSLGLVFRYQAEQQVVYSAHPFLREFFRNFLQPAPEAIHESVRSKLAPSLEAQPKAFPSDAAALDQYELLIEQTLLAGHIEQAFDLYWRVLGGHLNLAWRLGENVRALRIVESFTDQNVFAQLKHCLSQEECVLLLHSIGFFAYRVGDFHRARRAIELYYKQLPNGDPQATMLWTLESLEHDAGRLAHALKYADGAVLKSMDYEDKEGQILSLSGRGRATFFVGRVIEAMSDFRRATELQGNELWSYVGAYEAECKFLSGNSDGAISQAENARKWALEHDYRNEVCRCDGLLARISISTDAGKASNFLKQARRFAEDSGDISYQLNCFHAASELQLHLGDHVQAIAEAQAGILLADTCGFGLSSIHLRIALADALLVAGEPRKALQNAREALDRSEHPECQYAWGQADGLHFCGVAHLRLGERELAHQRLTAALELREKLGHRHLEKTKRALELC